MLFSLIARGGRFFVVAYLLHRYGARAREMIEKRLGLWVTLTAIGIVLGFVIVVKFF
jgi:hypothetical protein